MKNNQEYHDPFSLENKVVVVAGGSHGPGRTIAERLAEKKARVVIADANLIHAEVAVQGIMDKYKTDALAVSFHVNRVNTIGSTLKTIHQTWGEIAGWINASELPHNHQALEMQRGELDNLVDKNMKEIFMGCKEVAAYMIASNINGAIINVLSMKVLATLDFVPDLTAFSKNVSEETRLLSDDLQTHNVSLFTITTTPLRRSTDYQYNVLDGNYTFPDDIATLVLECISRSSKSITGKVFRIRE